MLSSLLDLVSPGGQHARLSVLVLHRILPEPDPLFPEAIDAQRFDLMCSWISSMFTTLRLDRAVCLMASGHLPRRAICITFDDGYADNLQVAAPILQRHGLSATFFIATGFLDGGCMWNDCVTEAFRRTRLSWVDLRELLQDPQATFATGTVAERRGAIDKVIRQIKYMRVDQRLAVTNRLVALAKVQLPGNLMMSTAQVQQLLRSGMQVGAHTVTHPILATLTAAQMRDEMTGSKRFLENLLGEAVTMFAYPNGKPDRDYNAQSVAVAREVGFLAAVTTARGAASRLTDPMQMPRFTPWDRTALRFGLRMASTLVSTRKGSAQLVCSRD